MSLGERKKHAMRRSARKHWPALMQKFNGRCHYCNERVMPVSLVPVADRVKETSHYITFRRNGEEIRVRCATIDHVKKIAEKGTNHFLNLVVSCFRCNIQRHRMKRQPQNQVCKKCGGPKEFGYRHRRYCKGCIVGFIVDYWEQHGLGHA